MITLKESLLNPIDKTLSDNTPYKKLYPVPKSKDFKKGVSVGEKTYGKGVMQTTYKLSNGSEVVFTVAEFFPHSGVSFNQEGINPDIKVTPTKEQLKYRYINPTEQDYAVSAALEYFKNLK